MATDSNTLLDEAKCLGCASNSSVSDMLKLGIWSRISSAYSAVQSFISRSGITDAVQIAAIEALAESAVQHGWWGKCDLIYPFVGGNATAHAQNLKSSSFTITWNGTVTHNANGITGDGATAYGDTGYIPSSSGGMGLSSAHISIYRRNLSTAPAGVQSYCGATQSVPSSNLGLRSPAVSDARVGFSVNDDNFPTFTPTTLGFLMSSRNNLVNKHLYNGSVDSVAVRNSVALPSFSLFILGRNSAGTANVCNVNVAAFTAGVDIIFSEYQVMSSDWQVFQTALGRQV